MEHNVFKSAEDLPVVDHLIMDEELSMDEQLAFCFAQAKDGRIYCLINLNAPETLKKRAQTLRNFNLEGREVVTYYTPPELLSIFRDQAYQDGEIEISSASELDKKFTEILIQSVRAGASDIHFEIYVDRADIKFRIHGLIYKVGELDSRTVNRLINYVYNVAAAEGSKDTQYNPEEMQDALLDRIVELDGQRRHFKLRLQTAPCYPNATTIVLRVLPVDSQLKASLLTLGYSDAQVAMLKRAQLRPTGATIIAGTTGSGKSTTLATLLTEIYSHTRGTKKILTTEDPPEYAIPGANQINLSTKKSVESKDENLFVKSIKVAMRCDPDIIMVGEVRDEKSANLLSSAVLSGHQVFTTVHASSALAIYNRLLNLGFEDHVLISPSFLSLLVYQTLVPLNCAHCAIPHREFVKLEHDEFTKATLHRLEKLSQQKEYQEKDFANQVMFHNNKGCNQCRQGISGRTVVAEMLEPTSEMLAAFRATEYDRAETIWKQQGGKTVLQHAVDRMFDTSIDPRYIEDRCGLLDALFLTTG